MELTAAMVEEKAFLGAEFLTWLWFAGERQEGILTLDDGEPIEVWIDDFLALESLMADSQENILKGGSPAISDEAGMALKTGKKVAKARIRIRKDEREWALVLKGLTLDPASVKLPTLMSGNDEEKLLERLYLLDELDGFLEGLYLQFLNRRFSPRWVDEELPAMRDWVLEKVAAHK